MGVIAATCSAWIDRESAAFFESTRAYESVVLYRHAKYRANFSRSTSPKRKIEKEREKSMLRNKYSVVYDCDCTVKQLQSRIVLQQRYCSDNNIKGVLR